MKLRDVLEEFKEKPLREVTGGSEFVRTLNLFLGEGKKICMDSDFEQTSEAINSIDFERRELLLDSHLKSSDGLKPSVYGAVAFLLGSTLLLLAFIMTVLLLFSNPGMSGEDSQKLMDVFSAILEVVFQHQ